MKNDRSRACMAKNKSEVCQLFITRAGPFVQFIRPSVVLDWNGYCIEEKKQYLCRRVGQRDFLKLSQLIGY